MAELKVTIPDDKVQLVLAAYAYLLDIEPTPEAVKQVIINDIKGVVKRYKLRRLESGQEDSVSQSDMEVEIS